MASPTLQFKRGLFVNLPALRAGEPGFTTDKNDLYIGIGGTIGDNKFFGSHRYWTKEDGTASLKLNLVDKSGDNSIGLRAPATLADSNTVYTLPSAPTDGYFLKTNSTGELEWSSVTAGASFDDVTISNSTFTGISTFSGLIDANAGLDVTGGSTFDNIDVTGIGTIATADINGGTIDGTVIGGDVAAEGTFTQLVYDNSSTSGISTVGELYVGTTQVLYDDGGLITLAGIQTVDATTIATLEALLSLDPNDFDTLNVTGIGTFGGLLDANGGLDVTGLAELDDVNVSGFATFTNAIDADILGNAGTASTATHATQVDTTATSDDVSYYIPFVANSSSTTGETIRVDSGISYNPSTDTLDVPNVETGTVKAKDGTGAITISDATGNVSFASTVTITGDLQVLGSTTTINTETLLIKDPVIEIGLVNNDGNLIAPSAPTATDLALVFHYYDTAAKQSSLYWDHDNENGERFVLASDLTGHTVGTATTSVEASAYAALEVGTLWINNACSDGAQEVIGCNGNSELALMNLVVDAGEF